MAEILAKSRASAVERQIHRRRIYDEPGAGAVESRRVARHIRE
jgi:hypothetical protein